MAFEIMKSIVEAEEKAESMKAKAIANAEVIRSQARAKSDEMAVNTKKQSKLDEEQLIQTAVADSQTKVLEILTTAHEKCKLIKKTANERKSKAIEAVVGKVVGKYGNC